MSFYERLDSLLRQKNISQRRMIIDFGLGKNTMFNWKHRNNIPNGEVLLKLSETAAGRYIKHYKSKFPRGEWKGKFK